MTDQSTPHEAEISRGPFSIDINKKTYQMRFDTRGLIEAEDITGLSLYGIQGISFKVVAALWYAAIRGQHGVNTYEHAAELLNLDFDNILDVVTDAYQAFLKYGKGSWEQK